MYELKYGKIIKVLEKDNQTPKALHRWLRDITYYNIMIQKGYSAILFYDNGNKATRTSYVQDIKEDENNLIIHTENSIYYIKKIIQ
jgi:uncharacterized phage-like protein YoqJ